ncbi:MAG: hypothetical protein EHM75_08195 [Desulfobacteraceae bacterium]|nr:MAG: hypothetical protein EHM75_08195 [Desulfobacteraceae bacterium]
MKRPRLPWWSLLPLLLVGCTITRTVEVEYLPGKASPVPASRVMVAVIPFEDTTWNGQENNQWVGQASLYGEKLFRDRQYFANGYPIGEKGDRGRRL